MSTQRTKQLDSATGHLIALVNRHAPGARLPTERELAAELGVGRSTLREAISQLVALGLVRVVHGRGMFAADGSPGDAGDDRAPSTAAGDAGRPTDPQTLLRRAAQGAHRLGMTEDEFLSAASAAYASESVPVRLVEASVVGPLPSAMRAEIARLLDAAGVARANRELAEVMGGPSGLVIAPWGVARRLGASVDVLPVGAALSVDVMIAVSGLAPSDEVTVHAADEETVAAVVATVHAQRPDLRLTGRVGAPEPASAPSSAVLVPEATADRQPAVGSRCRTGLTETERRALARKLRQPEVEPSTSARRASAPSRIGTASSHALE